MPRSALRTVLFELRAQKMAECRGLAPHALIGHALVSTEARLARPVDIPEMACRAEARQSEGRPAGLLD